jgi:hypothetical protein
MQRYHPRTYWHAANTAWLYVLIAAVYRPVISVAEESTNLELDIAQLAQVFRLRRKYTVCRSCRLTDPIITIKTRLSLGFETTRNLCLLCVGSPAECIPSHVLLLAFIDMRFITSFRLSIGDVAWVWS